MTEGDAIFAKILSDPACDTTRLVYADWLDEQGTKQGKIRARLIRSTIKMEREFGPDWFTLCACLDKYGTEPRWVLKAIERNWRDFILLPVFTRVMKVTKPVHSVAEDGSHKTSFQVFEEVGSLSMYSSKYNEQRHPGFKSFGFFVIDTYGAIPPDTGPPRFYFYDCVYNFSRGFYSRVICHFSHWNTFGDTVVAHEPVAEVVLRSLPVFEESSDVEKVLRQKWPTVANWILPEGGKT